jgi:hypothetical protein
LIETISRWFSKPGQPWTPVLLDNDRLDLAVARGAAGGAVSFMPAP